MKKAYGFELKAVKVGEVDPATTRMFGDPLLPGALASDENLFTASEIFIGQVNLEEYEFEGLPRKGILSFFMDYEEGTCHVFHFDPETAPDLTQIIEFNKDAGLEYGFDHEFEVEAFELENEVESGMKLLGDPAGYSELEDDEAVLFTYDPLEEGIEYLSQVDGYIYFVIKKKDLEKGDFQNVRLVIENS